MEKFNLNDYTNDFLWFSYFGVTKGEVVRGLKSNNENSKLKEALKRVCIQRAYRDLCRTLKFTYSNDWLQKHKKQKADYIELKKKFKECIENELLKKVEDIPTDKKKFDNWHSKTCEEIIERADVCKDNNGELYLFKRKTNDNDEEKADFTIGHAQKWVNMTLKNMLVMGLITDEKIISNLHVPIDSYILKIASQTDNEYGLGIKNKFGEWSKINNYGEVNANNNDTSTYFGYQNAIRNALGDTAPIAWEGKAWIEQAKLEKDKENKKDEQ